MSRLIHPQPDNHLPGARQPKLVRLSEIEAASELLRAKALTRQAGFTAEKIPTWLFKRRPILIDDGALHDQHRKELAKFFTLKSIENRGDAIKQSAKKYVEQALNEPNFSLEQLSLHYSVEVSAKIVGLDSPVLPLAKRLVKVFNQPAVDHTKINYGRSNRQWALAARKALPALAALYFKDVLPAILARKKNPGEDIISFLIQRGYSSLEILMECVTYATAGMVTTKEFICAAFWHLNEDQDLRALFLNSDKSLDILQEIIRLEPPVSHLYRRVAKTGTNCPHSAGTLVDIEVTKANLDPQLFGAEANKLCPDRKLRSAQRAGLSFGDGAHRCPGANLALYETEVLLKELLAQNARLTSTPIIEWDTLVQGYKLRNLKLSFS